MSMYSTACEIVLALYEVKHMELGGSEYPDAMWMLSKLLQTAVYAEQFCLCTENIVKLL